MKVDIGIELLCAVLGLAVLYLYLSHNFTYWVVRHVKSPPALPFLGSFKDVTFGKVLMCDYLRKLYDRYSKDRLVGLYAGNKPILLIANADFARDVFITDFSVFADRGITVNEEVDLFGSSLFSMKPDKWRVLRNKISPVFSSAKLRDMFYLVNECGEHFQEYLDELVGNGNIVECRQIATKFTADVIGTCAFGLELKMLNDENCEFLQMSRRVLDPRLKPILGNLMKSSMPWLYNMIGKYFIDTEIRDYFTKLIMGTLKYRREHGIKRYDFLDVLLDIQDHPEKVPTLDLTDKFIVAQAVLMFVAGFHSSSLTVAHALYELARTSGVQDRVRQEMKRELEKNGRVIDYQLVKSNLVYLDAVIKETLRKYTPLLFVTRQASRAYRFAGTNVVIPKGQTVWIPIHAIHYDSSIFPRPEVFDPERFMNNESEPSNQMAYLAFGDGPRNCLGRLFAEHQTKVVLLKILLNYKVDVCEKTKLKHTCAYRNSLLMPVGGIHVRMTKIKE